MNHIEQLIVDVIKVVVGRIEASALTGKRPQLFVKQRENNLYMLSTGATFWCNFNEDFVIVEAMKDTCGTPNSELGKITMGYFELINVNRNLQVTGYFDRFERAMRLLMITCANDINEAPRKRTKKEEKLELLQGQVKYRIEEERQKAAEKAIPFWTKPRKPKNPFE